MQVEGDQERELWRQQQGLAADQGGSWVPHTMTMALTEDNKLSVVEGEEQVTESKVGWCECQEVGD